MNSASTIGIVLGLLVVIGGNFSEGGKAASIFQPTAAFIVFGGTFGAILLSFPMSDLKKAFSSLREIFFESAPDPNGIIDTLVRCSDGVRRKGLATLEAEIPKINDGFLRRAVTLAVDRMSPRMLRETMEQEMFTYEAEKKRVARVFEAAGGYAPTIGILGAVLGLIRVMENLSEPSKLGAGIAVAFVATLYGVGSANLVLLPIARKLMNRLQRELPMREMIIEGVVCIQSGLNPYYLRKKLSVFLEEKERFE